jgi:hypothetical protein
MKITLTYVLPSDSGAPAVTTQRVLGDDSVGDKIGGYLPSATVVVQSVPRPRAPGSAFFNRRNRAWEIVWQTTRTHADEAAALDFLEDHPAEVTQQGTLRIERNGRSRIGDDAVVESCVARSWDGATTVHEYRARCGTFRSGSQPNNY